MDSFENFELIEDEHLMQESFKFNHSDSGCKNPFWDLFNATETGPHLSNNNNIHNTNNNDPDIWSDELLDSIVAPELAISEEIDNFSHDKESNSKKSRGNLVFSQNLGGEVVNVNLPVELNSENLGVKLVISEGENNYLGEKECNFENSEGINENVSERERNPNLDERERDNSQDMVLEMLIERESQEERERMEHDNISLVNQQKMQINEGNNVPSFSLMESNLRFPLMKFESLERENGSEMDSECVLQDPYPLSESSPESHLIDTKLVESQLVEASIEESPMIVSDFDLKERSDNTIDAVDSDSNEGKKKKSNGEKNDDNTPEKDEIADVIMDDVIASPVHSEQEIIEESDVEESDGEVYEKVPEISEEQIPDKTFEECEITNESSKEEISEKIPEKFEEVSDKIPEKFEEQVSDKFPEKFEEQVSEKIPEKFEEQVFDKIPEKCEEQVSDKTLEECEITNESSKEEIEPELSLVKISSESNEDICTVIGTSLTGTLFQPEQEREDETIHVDLMATKNTNGENYKITPEIRDDVTMQDAGFDSCTDTVINAILSEEKSMGENNYENAPEKCEIENDFSPEEINSNEKSDGEINAERTLEKIEITNETEADMLNSVDSLEAKKSNEEEENYKNAPETSVENSEKNLIEEKDSEKAPQVSDFTKEIMISEEKDRKEAPQVSDFSIEMSNGQKDRKKAPEESEFTKEMVTEEKEYEEEAPEKSDIMDGQTSEEKDYKKAPEASDFTDLMDENIGKEKDSERDPELSGFTYEKTREEKDSEKALKISVIMDGNVGEVKDYGYAPDLSDFTSEKTGEEKDYEKTPEFCNFTRENVSEEKISEKAPDLSASLIENITEEKNSKKVPEIEKVSEEALKGTDITDGKISEEKDYKKAPEISDFSNEEICEEKDSKKAPELSDFMDEVTSEDGNYDKAPEISEFTNKASKDDILVEKASEEKASNDDILVEKTSEEKDYENKKNSEEKDSENTLGETEVENNGNEEIKFNSVNEIPIHLENEINHTVPNDSMEIDSKHDINNCVEKSEVNFVSASKEEDSKSDRCQATIGPFENKISPKFEQINHEKSDCQNDIISTNKEQESKPNLEKLEKDNANLPKCPSSSSSQVAPEEIANNASPKGKNVILPDLNSSESPKVPPVGFLTEGQKRQLKAHIFVYGCLVEGSLPDKAHMEISFEQSERSMWIALWNAYSERLKKQKISNIDTPSPSSSKSSTESVSKSPLQNPKLSLYPQINSSKNPYKTPVSRFRFETENPKRKRKHSVSPDSYPTNKNSPAGRKHPLHQFASTTFWGPKPNLELVLANESSPGGTLQNVPARQLNNNINWGPKPNYGIVRANQVLPGGHMDVISSLIYAANQKRERDIYYANYQIALAQMHSVETSPKPVSNQIVPSGVLVNKQNNEQIVYHQKSPEINYEITPLVLTDEQLKIQKAFESAENIAKKANEIARMASEAALNAKLLADEALQTLTGQNPNPVQNTLTPIKPINNNNNNNDYNNNNNVNEIVSNMKEASRRRVEKAILKSKEAENLESIMKGAELAAQIVNETGQIIMMGDPLPFCIEDMVKELTRGVKGKEIALHVQEMDFESKGNGEDELIGNGEDELIGNGEERVMEKGNGDDELYVNGEESSIKKGLNKINKSNEGDSLTKKRQKMGPIHQEIKSNPKPKILERIKNTKNDLQVKNDTKQKSLNTRANTKKRERENIKEKEIIPEPEQKKVKTCFGIPKSNKNTDFVKDLLPNWSQNPKPNSNKDSIPNSSLKIDAKSQNPKPKIGKNLVPNLGLKNMEKGKRAVIERGINKRQITAPKGQTSNLEKKNLVSSVKGQNGNMEKKKIGFGVKGQNGNSNKFEGVNVNENVGESSGLRRSSRKIKPTSKLLEGIQSSNLGSKVSNVEPTKIPVSKKGRARQ